jgi:hypothetical protein
MKGRIANSMRRQRIVFGVALQPGVKPTPAIAEEPSFLGLVPELRMLPAIFCREERG